MLHSDDDDWKAAAIKSTHNTSEVYFILKSKKELHKQVSYSKVFEDTFSYVTRFAKIKDLEATKSLQAFLEKTSLSLEERAQIMNLCPKDSKEAKKLITSLESRADVEIESIINEINLLK